MVSSYGTPSFGFYETNNQIRKKTMKLLLTAFCAAIFVSPLAFAEGAEKKCEKKCDKDKQEETLTAEAGEKKKCDKEEVKEETIAHCGKCGKCKDCKDGVKCEKCKKHEEEKDAKKEGTLMAEAEKKKCDKCPKKAEEEKEATLA
jgi:hypothetical protein